jgi:Galactose-1-phosphate uridyltransferase
MTAPKPGAPVTAEQAQAAIGRLVRYALHHGLIKPADRSWALNALLDLFGFTEPGAAEDAAAGEGPVPAEAAPILDPLIDYGIAVGLVPDDTMTSRDLLDARIMGLVMPRPSETADAFARLAEREGVEAATDAFYKLNIASNYVRMDRVRQNEYWVHDSAYGGIEITINLSKPEKDPREIARIRSLPPSSYPKCLLCPENVGYAGRPDHPARQNLRVLPLKLNGEDWFFQYSPYVYYNEHSIILRAEHVPMAITDATFKRLFDFLDRFPHYFVGSNADLPIVGGSILNHDHFQAGRHPFAMEKAETETAYRHPEYPGLSCGIVRWPMSVLRLAGARREELEEAAAALLGAWRNYSDPSADILAHTAQADGSRQPHNTITPIARRKPDGRYELDLVLRNNRTSAEHPDGIFHPHRHLHHIKRENIGLIEVMGLAVLPGRLKRELRQIAAILSGERPYDPEACADASHPLHRHADWLAGLVRAHGTSLPAAEAERLLRAEVGRKFTEVLCDAGVFKRDEAGRAAFAAFAESAGWRP